MITLYQYSPKWGINASPFCLKIELTLRLFDMPFEVVSDMQKIKSPKNKLPVIDDEGTLVADSEFILDYLEKTYGKSLNAGLSDYQKSISYAYKKMLEDHLYWVALYFRWFDPVNEKATREAYFKGYPEEIIGQVYAKTRRDFDGTGLGLHSKEELVIIGIKCLNSIYHLVKEKKGRYIFGDSFTEIDVIMYSFVGQILNAPISSPLKEHIKKLKELEHYLSFLHDTWHEK